LIYYHVARGNLELEKRKLDRDELYRLRVEDRLPAAKYGIRLDSRTKNGRVVSVVGTPEISRLFHQEAFAVRRIVRMLGISTSSIYHHVSGVTGFGSLAKTARELKRQTLPRILIPGSVCQAVFNLGYAGTFLAVSRSQLRCCAIAFMNC
jgi:hypothetical protein